MPQTKADSELQLKLDCQAPFVAYALLCVRAMFQHQDLRLYYDVLVSNITWI